MKNLKNLFSVLLITGALFVTQNSFAQTTSGHDINVEFSGVSLLDVVSPTDVNISLNGDYGSTEAGEEIQEGSVIATNSDNRLHYTVFNPQGGTNTYKISVAASGFEGAGWDIDLSFVAGAFGGGPNPQGTYGSTQSLRSGTSQDMVTDISKIAWTGTDEAADGYALQYDLKVTDFDTFEAGNDTEPITVTYTLSEE